MARKPLPATITEDGPAEAEQDPLDLPNIRVYGEQLKGMSVISWAGMTVVVGIGRVEGRDLPALVPYVNLFLRVEAQDELEGDLGFEQSSQFSRTVTHDNAAFILARLSSDYSDACAELGLLSNPKAMPDRARILQSRTHMVEARDDITRCVGAMDDILAMFEKKS